MNYTVVIMLSNYFHDLATGLLFGSVVTYFVARRALGQPGATFLSALFQRFRPVVIGSLVAVVVLGVPRMIFFEEIEMIPAAEKALIPALIVKHVFLVGVTVGSLVVFFRANPDKPGAGSA